MPNSEEPVDGLVDHALREAIHAKRLLRFRYKDAERIAEPHDYGIQNGVVRLFCYQVGGRSTGQLPGWRMMNVADMQECQVLDKTFAGNRDTSSGAHHRWDGVFIRVAPPEE